MKPWSNLVERYAFPFPRLRRVQPARLPCGGHDKLKEWSATASAHLWAAVEEDQGRDGP